MDYTIITIIVLIFINIFTLFINTLILIGNFNIMQENKKNISVVLNIEAKNTTILILLLKLLGRYEKNLATWYNDMTGRNWALEKEEENAFKDLKRELENINKTLLLEKQKRIQNQ